MTEAKKFDRWTTWKNIKELRELFEELKENSSAVHAEAIEGILKTMEAFIKGRIKELEKEYRQKVINETAGFEDQHNMESRISELKRLLGEEE